MACTPMHHKNNQKIYISQWPIEKRIDSLRAINFGANAPFYITSHMHIESVFR